MVHADAVGGGMYLCQRILLLWREIYVSEKQGVVLDEDKIREYSFGKGGPCQCGAWALALALGVGCEESRWLPCRAVVEFQQSQKG